VCHLHELQQVRLLGAVRRLSTTPVCRPVEFSFQTLPPVTTTA
jgi:hypothetical protein